MIGLTIGRNDYKCSSCGNDIPSGVESLSRGHTYRGGSNGRYCVDCIIETGKILEMRKLEKQRMEVLV